MGFRRALITIIAAGTLSLTARADVVTDWNGVALNVIRGDRLNPPRATRALAMMHVAMYDAVNGVTGAYEPYRVTKRAPHGASAEAAAAVAAHTVLSSLFPARRATFNAALQSSLAHLQSGAGRNQGQVYGRECAKNILAWRARDDADRFVDYEPSGIAGRWQPTPPALAPALLPQWPYVTPFAMRSGTQFREQAPPAFDSPEYAAAFNEVKTMGGTVSARTPDQTQIAYFWEDGPGTVTPAGHWQVIAQQLAQRFETTVPQNARLFALLSITQADAAIAAWDTKYRYDFVRPITAVRLEADQDGNPETSADPAWTSLIPTPPFPSYTSGHSTFSGASSKILELFFGTDDIAFSMSSPDPQRWPAVLPGVVRSWDSLSEAAEEAGQSRIYGGIHWQFDNTRGLDCGRVLAQYVFEGFLRPVGAN